MSDLEAWRAKAAAWCESMVPTFGKAARKGLSVEDDLALGRRYQKAKFDAGFAGINWPTDLGGQGLGHIEKITFEAEEMKHGFPNVYFGISLGMPVPVLMQFGPDRDFVKEHVLKALQGEEIWCQLFSEPSGGTDLAGLRTRAETDGNGWKINGQKVWTSWAQYSDYGVIVVRTDPTVAKHKGLTYFVVDMHGPGVETRPLRQLTGQAEFNEVYFTDARIPDTHRLGEVGNGWNVAMTTLMNERTALGGSGSRRGAGTIADATGLWASRPHRHTPVLRDRLTQLWLRSEAQRLTSERSRASAGVGGPGPEGSIGKLVGAELNQHIYQWCMDFLGPEGLLYHGYGDGSREERDDRDWQGPIQQRFLRSRANTIEGGTSEVMRNILGERILGLPGDLRADSGMPWKEIPRG